MGLLGSLGGMSFDQERERLDKIRTPATQVYRRSVAAIEQEVDQATAWLRELLGQYVPAARQILDVQLRLAPLQAQLVEQATRAAAQLAPDQMAASAQSELAAQLQAARAEQERRLQRMGVDPGTIRATALDRGMDVVGTAEMARVGTNARLAGAQAAMGLAGMAQQLRQGDLGAAMGVAPALQGLAGLRAGVLGSPLQQATGLTNLVMQGAQLRQAANASQVGALNFLGGALGTLAGLGLGAYALNTTAAAPAAGAAAAGTASQTAALADAFRALDWYG